MKPQLEFNGERFVPECVREIWHEHWHRYVLVCELVRGARVLDVASGEGYGSHLLADYAQEVIGIDISERAVRHAAARYGDRSNLHYLMGSCDRLPLAAGSVDVVVSFETIEHIETQREMLAEVRRVLREDGLLIMSSPNKKTYTDDRGYHNEFHVRELYLDEFEALLRTQFPAVHMLGQKLLFQSALWPLNQTPRRVRLAAGQEEDFTLGGNIPQEPLYFVAVCAASAERLAQLGDTLWLLNESDESVYRHYDEMVRLSTWLDGELRQCQARVAECERALAGQRAQMEALQAALAAHEQSLAARLRPLGRYVPSFVRTLLRRLLAVRG